MGSSAVFQSATAAAGGRPLSTSSTLRHPNPRAPFSFPIAKKPPSRRPRPLFAIRSSSASALGPACPSSFSGEFLQRCFDAAGPSTTSFSSSSSSTSSFCHAAAAANGSSAVMAPVMKKDYGAFGTVTLEKSKLDLSQKTTSTSPEVSFQRNFMKP